MPIDSQIIMKEPNERDREEISDDLEIQFKFSNTPSPKFTNLTTPILTITRTKNEAKNPEKGG
jgi:hypothetical protein